MKEKIHDFLTFMMTYIKENQMENDKFMKMLCDDLYISYSTIGTEKQGAYTCARHTSQGRQTTYNVSLNDCDFNNNNNNNNNNIPNLSDYTLSDNIDSPYATQGVLQTMRTISQPSQPLF